MFQGMHYVYEVYKEMSFSKAARNLFISQPSLRAAVKKAERQNWEKNTYVPLRSSWMWKLDFRIILMI